MHRRCGTNLKENSRQSTSDSQRLVGIAEHQDIHHGEDAEQSCWEGKGIDNLQVEVVCIEVVRLVGYCRLVARDIMLVRAPILAKCESYNIIATWPLGSYPKALKSSGGCCRDFRGTRDKSMAQSSAIWHV